MDREYEQSSLSNTETEKFWTEGHSAYQSSTGANLQPGTSTTLVGAHGLCRHCGEAVKRNADGFWVHAADGVGVLCEGRLCPAEPIRIDMPGVGVVLPQRPYISPDCAGRESVVGEVPQPRDPAGDVLRNSEGGAR